MRTACRGRRINRMLILALVISWFIPIYSVSAADTISLPPRMVVGDDQGVKVQTDGSYFVEVHDVEPGKKWSTKITLINLEKEIPYRLTLHVKAPKLVEGTLDLSQEIQMTLIYENQIIYEGPLSGISEKKNLQDTSEPIDLGLFKSGETRMLEAQFELDGKKYTNRDFFQKNVMENEWIFKAVKTGLPDTESPDDPNLSIVDKIKRKLQLPQTGEEWENALLYFCLGLFLLLVGMLIIRYKQTNCRK